MANRQFFIPGGGVIHEEGEEEYFIPGVGVIAEDQAAVAADALEEDAGLFIAGQQQPVFERAGMIPY